MLQALIKNALGIHVLEIEGGENSFISTVFFFFIFRAVGCIFGELLNNSPLFPVSENIVYIFKYVALRNYITKKNPYKQN